MSSNGRYLYHNQPATTTMSPSSSYEYAHYQPTPPYEPTQIPHPQHQQPPAVRHIRSTSQPQSPHTQTSFTHPPPPPPHSPAYQHQQQPSYPPTYTMNQPPTQQQQWQPTGGGGGGGSGWPHYTTQAFPPAPIPEVSFNSGPGRPDVEPTPSSSMERGVMDSGPSNPDARRNEEQRPAVPPSTPSQPRSRRREKESPLRATVLNSTTTTIDFTKLLQSYRAIIDESSVLSDTNHGQHRQPLVETIERMVQSAAYGAQMLESARPQQTSPLLATTTTTATAAKAKPEPVRQSTEPETSEDSKEDEVNGSKTPKGPKVVDSSSSEGQTCLGCSATSTPEWRRGPMGPRTLCNACGLVYAKLIKKRARERAKEGGRKTNGKVGVGPSGLGDDSGLVSSGDGGSDDDDDSYGRLSELDDRGL